MRLPNTLGIRLKLFGLAFGVCHMESQHVFPALSFPTPLWIYPPSGVLWMTAWTMLARREVMRWTPDLTLGPLFPYLYLPGLLSLVRPWGLSKEKAPVRTLLTFAQPFWSAFILPDQPYWNLTLLQNIDKGTILCICSQALHPGGNSS